MTRGPSPHLTWAELACRDAARTVYPVKWRDERAGPLAHEFERVRELLGGRPIYILSAYRTPAHNRAVKGADASQHVEGRALDLRPPTGVTVTQLRDAVLAIARRDDSRIYGVGIYPSFVHLDIRPKPDHGRLIVWHGSRAWAEPKAKG